MPILLNSPTRRAAVIWAAVIIHLAASVGLLLVAEGTEANQDMSARFAFVTAHRLLWTTVWVVWMFASASLLAFCAAWSFAMADHRRSRFQMLFACGIIAAGLIHDIQGETALILAARSQSPTQFAVYYRVYQIFSPAIANGLYCVGGLWLSLIAWKCNWLRGWGGALGFAMWIVGFGLTIGGILDHRELLAITGAGVMILFLMFASAVAWRMQLACATA